MEEKNASISCRAFRVIILFFSERRADGQINDIRHDYHDSLRRPPPEESVVRENNKRNPCEESEREHAHRFGTAPAETAVARSPNPLANQLIARDTSPVSALARWEREGRERESDRGRVQREGGDKLPFSVQSV